MPSLFFTIGWSEVRASVRLATSPQRLLPVFGSYSGRTPRPEPPGSHSPNTGGALRPEPPVQGEATQRTSRRTRLGQSLRRTPRTGVLSSQPFGEDLQGGQGGKRKRNGATRAGARMVRKVIHQFCIHTLPPPSLAYPSGYVTPRCYATTGFGEPERPPSAQNGRGAIQGHTPSPSPSLTFTAAIVAG